MAPAQGARRQGRKKIKTKPKAMDSKAEETASQKTPQTTRTRPATQWMLQPVHRRGKFARASGLTPHQLQTPRSWSVAPIKRNTYPTMPGLYKAATPLQELWSWATASGDWQVELVIKVALYLSV